MIPLDALFSPRSIAVVGASSEPAKVGGMPLKLLTHFGYEGAIYPVNPARSEIQGLRAWPQVAELPGPVDLAVVAVPARDVVSVVEQLAACQARAAIVLSSGFAEVGEAGALAQQRLATVASDAGMALLGPNCLGTMSPARRLYATFSPAPLAGVPPHGPVAIVSQSGAFGAYAFSLARKAGLGLSHWVTTGNEAQLSVADVIDWLADDADTRVILAYVEGTRDGLALRRALARARRAGKPVIVTKVGRTEVGARAAMSHTASLSGEDAVYQAIFDATGAIRARTVEEMFRLGQAFALSPPPAGRRLAIVTISGGVGTLMADSASDEGLALPPLPESVAAPLRQRIPFCSTQNPVDVTGQVTADMPVLTLAAEGAAASGSFDAVALFVAAALSSPALAPAVMATVRQTRRAAPGVPLALSGIADERTRQALLEEGCLVYQEPTQAVEVLAAQARWAAGRADPVAPAMHGLRDVALDAAIDAALPIAVDVAAGGAWNEAEALAFLAAQGIAVMPHRWVRSGDAAVKAWQALGGPVVLKVVSPDLLHKSDVGGVRLRLDDEAGIRAAVAAIDESVTRLAPTARRAGWLVARQLSPVAEVMLGARFDPAFGPVIVLGLGGVAVELFGRTAVLLAPTEPGRVLDQLGRLGILTLLDGWRGGPRVAPQALVDTILAFARLAAALGPRLQTLEINPLLVTADGVAAADAVISLASDQSVTVLHTHRRQHDA